MRASHSVSVGALVGSLGGQAPFAPSLSNRLPQGDAAVSVVRSPAASGGPWACVGSDDNGCPAADGAFRLAHTVVGNSYYYFAVVPVAPSSPPSLRLGIALYLPSTFPG